MTELFGCFQATTFHCYQNSMTYTTTPTLRETEAHNSSAEKPELKQRLFSLTLNFLSMFVLSLSNYLTVNITLWPLDAHMSRGLISSLQYWHYLDYLIMKQAITFNSTHWKCTHFRVNVNTWWSVPLSSLPPHLSLPMPVHCPQHMALSMSFHGSLAPLLDGGERPSSQALYYWSIMEKSFIWEEAKVTLK